MPAHIAPVACLKQAQKNKGNKKPLKPCLLRRRRIVLIHINYLLRRKAHSSFFNSYIIDMLPRISILGMAHNVPAVNGGFLRPIRKNAQRFFGRKKMWLRETPQRALARLVFRVARSADR